MTAPDREGAAVEALVGILVGHQRIPLFDGTLNQRCSGCDTMRGDSDGPNSPRHARHLADLVIAAGWVPESEVREREAAAWDRGVKAHARQQLDIAYGRARQFSDPVNPYRAERIEEGE